MQEKVFPIIPASTLPLWSFALIMVFLLASMVVFGWFLYWSKHTVVLIDEQGLEIPAGPFARKVAMSSLLTDQAEIVDLDVEQSLRPGIRTNGLAVPGYKAGWFKLKNGQKALIYLTKQNAVLSVPTTEGFHLLLSVASPEDALDRLLQASGRAD